MLCDEGFWSEDGTDGSGPLSMLEQVVLVSSVGWHGFHKQSLFRRGLVSGQAAKEHASLGFLGLALRTEPLFHPGS